MDPFADWPDEKLLRLKTIARFAAAIGKRLLDKKHAVANCVIRELYNWSSDPKNLLSPEGVGGLYVVSHPPSQAVAHLYDAARFFRKPERAKLSLEQALRLTDKFDHPARKAVIEAWASDIPIAPEVPKVPPPPPKVRGPQQPVKPPQKKRSAQNRPAENGYRQVFDRVCPVCGRPAIFETEIWKNVGWYETNPTIVPHLAMCGRPCLGGRIRHEQFGLNHHDVGCDACVRRGMPIDGPGSESDECSLTIEFEIRP